MILTKALAPVLSALGLTSAALGQRTVVSCAVCGMEVDLERAEHVNGKWYCVMPGLPCKRRLEGRDTGRFPQVSPR